MTAKAWPLAQNNVWPSEPVGLYIKHRWRKKHKMLKHIVAPNNLHKLFLLHPQSAQVHNYSNWILIFVLYGDNDLQLHFFFAGFRILNILLFEIFRLTIYYNDYLRAQNFAFLSKFQMIVPTKISYTYLIGSFCAHSTSNFRTETLCFVIAAITLLVSTFILLAPSLHCRCTEGKTKCTSCVSL